MKKILFSLSALFLIGMVNAQTTGTTQVTQPVDETKTEITFTSLEHNYGTIEFDANGTCEFEFTNTGKVALTLSNVQASCGCTAPEWSKEPIKPGEKGKITVKYNTKLPGTFQKTIKVFSNSTVSPVVLTIKGEIKPKTQQDQPTK
jgi:hypothetical protein